MTFQRGKTSAKAPEHLAERSAAGMPDSTPTPWTQPLQRSRHAADDTDGCSVPAKASEAAAPTEMAKVSAISNFRSALDPHPRGDAGHTRLYYGITSEQSDTWAATQAPRG